MKRTPLNKVTGYNRQDQGIALVVVLWLLALMSFFAATFASDTRNQAEAFRNQVGIAKMRAAADGGVHLGIRELLRETGGEHSELPWLIDGSPYEIAMTEEIKLTISLHDEGGKIDINTASEDVIRGIGRALDYDPGKWDAIADAILDWRDEDNLKRLNGAEDNAYANANLPYGAKNGYYQSIDEIQQVLGVDYTIFRKIAQAITIYSRRDAINPTTAPRLALQALPGADEREIDAALTVREENRSISPRTALRQLSHVNKWLHADRGPVYTVRATAKALSGYTFIREAVIWIPKEGKRQYWILDWRATTTSDTLKNANGRTDTEVKK